MHIVLLSEHADPLIGGATHLTKKIAETLSGLGHKLTFIVPNSNSSETEFLKVKENYCIVKVKAKVPIDDRSKFRGKKRREYAIEVSEFIKSLHSTDPINIIQILSGMYLLRHLDVPYFKEKKIKLVAGILNVPPEECGLSWKGDKFVDYYKDLIRKLLVKKINRKRIGFHSYDAYTVESQHVKEALSKIVSANLIHYIPLGTDENKVKIFPRSPNSSFKILTVGGINPSKNQHIIPLIARQLLDKGINFQWDIIGPDRNNRYTIFLQNEIRRLQVESVVKLTLGMAKEDLMKYYEKTDIYVQTSIEEGFCMTALDAIIYGLPLIGISTGAIAEFIEKGKGVLVENVPGQFADAIQSIINNPDKYSYHNVSMDPILKFYNWGRISRLYVDLYFKLLDGNRKDGNQITLKEIIAS